MPNSTTTASGRPIYKPEPGGIRATREDLITHLRADISWLEAVIRATHEDLLDGDEAGAFLILKHSGVTLVGSDAAIRQQRAEMADAIAAAKGETDNEH